MPVIFENPGILDERALYLSAINVKEDAANAIGYFGTGMKYAVAICCRLGWRLIIQPGDGTEHEVEMVPTELWANEEGLLRRLSVNHVATGLRDAEWAKRNWPRAEYPLVGTVCFQFTITQEEYEDETREIASVT